MKYQSHKPVIAGIPPGSQDPQGGQHRHLAAHSILCDHCLFGVFLLVVFLPQMALKQKASLHYYNNVQMSL